jgi:hypothetical protein
MKIVPSLPGFSVTEDGQVFSNTRTFIKSDGRRMSVQGRLRKQSSTQGGYKIVSARVGNKTPAIYVHRLVAEAYIPNPENKPEINHKDGDPSNNHFSNLEWVTHSENMRHAVDTGALKPQYRFDEATRQQIIREYLDHTFTGVYQHLANKYDCDQKTITRMLEDITPRVKFGRISKETVISLMRRLNELPFNCHRVSLLSKEFGIGYITLKRVIKDLGFEV